MERGKKSKEIGKEHHRIDEKGDLAGVYSIDGRKAKTSYGMWDGVDAIVKEYIRLHPNEIRLTVVENMAVKQNNYDKLGSGKSKGVRHSLSIPHGLMFSLEQFEPTLFTNTKTLHEFMTRYEGFRTCESV